MVKYVYSFRKNLNLISKLTFPIDNDKNIQLSSVCMLLSVGHSLWQSTRKSLSRPVRIASYFSRAIQSKIDRNCVSVAKSHFNAIPANTLLTLPLEITSTMLNKHLSIAYVRCGNVCVREYKNHSILSSSVLNFSLKSITLSHGNMTSWNAWCKVGILGR